MDEQFIVNILAQLDTSKINQQLKELSSNKTVTVKVEADLSKFQKQLENAVKDASVSVSPGGGSSSSRSQASQSVFIKQINSAMRNLNLGTYDANLKRIQSSLSKWGNISTTTFLMLRMLSKHTNRVSVI